MELNEYLHKHWLRDPFYCSLSPEEKQLFLEDYKDTLQGHVFTTEYYTKEVLKDIARALGETMGRGDGVNEKR